MPLPWSKYKEDTERAMQNPLPGMHFHEMYSFHLFVVRREGNVVWWVGAAAPCEFPKDGVPYVGSLTTFQRRYNTSAGYWVMFDERTCPDVSGWWEEAILHHPIVNTDAIPAAPLPLA